MTNGKALARWCRAQIGTSYSVMDCIKLVVNGIRKAKGADGESITYTCGGTNELWRSINQSGKYRYVTEIVPIAEAKRRGMLVPGRLMVIWEAGHNAKYNDDLGNCSHIGVYCGDADCEAVHSSFTHRRVAATTVKNGFTHVLTHRLIDLDGSSNESTAPEETPAQTEQVGSTGTSATVSVGYANPGTLVVTTEKDPLNVRDRPTIKGDVIGKVVRGATVTATGNAYMVVEDGVSRVWVEITFKSTNRRRELTGYACADYLAGIESAPSVQESPTLSTRSIDYVTVPRSVILALADGLHEAETFLGDTQSAAMLCLMTTARDVTAYLEGDD